LTVAKKEKEALAFNKKEIKNVPEKRNAWRAKIRGRVGTVAKELPTFSKNWKNKATGIC